MIQSPPPQPQAILNWMEALADATRLRLLRLLERHELGVAELCNVLQLPQSTVSRHLKLLADQHWVRNRRQGTANLYRMLLDELDPAARRLWLLARSQTEEWATCEQDRVRLTHLLDERQDDARSFFAEAAAQWDTLRRELYGRVFDLHALTALLPQDYIVADLGCGTGQLTASLAPLVGQVIGVDQSRPMLEAARHRTRDMANVDLRTGDLSSLPIKDETCHAALLVLSLSYLADPQATLDEMRRILRPGGIAVVVDLLRHDREDFRRQMGQQCLGFDAAELEAMLGAARLRNIHVTPLPPEPQARGPALLLGRALAPR